MKFNCAAFFVLLIALCLGSAYGEAILPQYWPEKVIVQEDTDALSGGETIQVKKGASFVLIRAEGDQLVLSGRINALKVPTDKTDFAEQAEAIKEAGISADRGIVNGLLVGRLRFLDGEAFRPVQVKDSDLYKRFFFIYLEEDQACNKSFIPMLKGLHEQHIAGAPSKVMVMFSKHSTPNQLYDFVYSHQMPWKTVVFHMATGYREAFQHDVEAPACVLTDQYGRVLQSYQLNADSNEAELNAALKGIEDALVE